MSIFNLPQTSIEFAAVSEKINSVATKTKAPKIARVTVIKKSKTTVPVAQTSAANVVVSTDTPAATTTVVKTKMKRWPDNPTELVPYKDLAGPLKEALNKGYRLFRREEVKSVDYDGFNIGKHELINTPSSRERLSEKLLEQDKKSGTNLIDVVLNLMFLLGVEQGRRAERRDTKPIETLMETLEIYREKNKDLRMRTDELEVILDIKEKFPDISPDVFNEKVKLGVASRRTKRIQELKSELQLDVSKSSFKFKPAPKAKFKELELIVKNLTKDICSPEQWKQILVQRGWTYKEWKEKCKKKFINKDFS